MPRKPQSAQPSPRRGGRFESFGLFGGSTLLVVAGFWLAAQFIQPAPPRQISIAAGQSGGAYLEYAERYRAELAQHGITLEVLETDGTVDNLSRLLREDDPVDLALVQGGVATEEERARGSGLGSMFYEPLWLFTPAGAPERTLGDLDDLRIGIGAEGSGTRRLVVRLLGLNGVPPDDERLHSMPSDEAAEALAGGDLDLMFAVSAPDSPLLERLLDDPAIQLQPLPRAAAYARIDRTLSLLELPRGTLSLAEDLPGEDLVLVAATANLVAHPDIHPALVDLLIQAAAAVHGAGSVLAPPETFPTPLYSDFPLGADAVRHYKEGPPFLQRYLPFWAATWIDRTKVMLLPMLALLLPLVKILPPIYAWRIRRRILRWYVQLRRVDLELATGSLTAEQADDLAEELRQIESDAAQIDVPLSYTDQLYNLRLHIRLLQQKLDSVGIGAPTR
jgi:TRAP-type uncharacterized transport system substrate-binding protein